jgi:undecaprenyl-diphosphatase
MNIFWALILGTVQGLTEFFPVSSSAHLTVLPWIFKFPDPGLSFDIALHAGSFLAIIALFWAEWFSLAKAFFSREKSFEKNLAWFLIVTSVPGAIIGALLESKAEGVFRNPLLVALTLVAFGLVLYFVDRLAANKKELKEMNLKSALLIGLSQAVAIIPGVSRSGATITAGRALGFSRESAVKYSFLAAAPIILGAAVFGLRHATATEIFSINWVIGFLAAALSSFWAMKVLLNYVKTKTFSIFLYYRIALAAVILLLYLIRR